MATPLEVTILESLSKVDVLLLLHGGCGVLQHPGGRVVASTDLIRPKLLEIVNQIFGALPKWPTVQGASTTLQQQQIIKRLQRAQQQAVSLNVLTLRGSRKGRGGGGDQGAGRYVPQSLQLNSDTT